MQVLLSLVAFPVYFQAPVDDELWKEENHNSALLRICWIRIFDNDRLHRAWFQGSLFRGRVKIATTNNDEPGKPVKSSPELGISRANCFGCRSSSDGVASPLLPSPPRSLSTAALSTTAREIAALIAAGDLEASVKHAKQFLFFEAGRASEEVPSLYRAVVSAAAAPRGKPSDSDHLSAAASALVEASMGAALPDGALRLLEDLIDTPGAPLPSGPSCDLLMENLLVLRCHAHVRRVFGILAAAGERPGTAAWNCVVRACAMEGDLDEALLKLRRMRRRRDGGVPPGPDAHTYSCTKGPWPVIRSVVRQNSRCLARPGPVLTGHGRHGPATGPEHRPGTRPVARCQPGSWKGTALWRPGLPQAIYSDAAGAAAEP
jgi:pentatricopeptide repeat protein